MENLQELFIDMGIKARRAAQELSLLDEETKNKALKKMSKALIKNIVRILDANMSDIEEAKENGMSNAMIDRLQLTGQRIQDIADSLLQVCELEDPTKKVLAEFERPNGLLVKQITVPLGVCLIIYESRPNVTIDATALSLKAGNAVILRGGKEAFNTNKILVEVMRDAAESAGINPDIVQFVPLIDREALDYLFKMKKYIDVVIPRGSASLIERVVRDSLIPVIETGSGVVHIYVDAEADLEKALSIILNAKIQRPSVCNAVETLLIHKHIAKEFLPKLLEELHKNNVEIRCGNDAKKIVKQLSLDEIVTDATPLDWHTEYNDLIVSIGVVNSLEEAITHIEEHGTKHSECIITENEATAHEFMDAVDASTVYVNASTRFTDGFEFGFGAEIGISTQKLHARGPMGLQALTTYKYYVFGNGHIRE